MAQKNDTPALILALLITLGLLGAGYWWFTHKPSVNVSQSNNSTSTPSTSNTASNSNQSNTSNSDLASVPLISGRGVDYTTLRNDLQSHDWKKANEQTTEDLLKAFGLNSDKTGNVDPQEAANPPCADLKTVDQLWSKASNGNLGFTAQRQVLQQAGNDYRKAYNEMQWQRPGGEWLIQYTYDGHREHFKPGYEPDYGNPDKGTLPTFERGYNFKYSFDGTLSKCGL